MGSRFSLLSGVVAAGLVAGAAHAAQAPELSLRWLGQSAFVLRTPGGATVLLDPIPASIGYTLPREPIAADAVVITHEHPDHTNVALAAGKPPVLRGLTAQGKDWAKVDAQVKDVHVTSVPTFHDAEQGKKRGKNAVMVLEVATGGGSLRLVHLGDLGHELSPEQVKAIGKVDVLLVPVGGHFTIGPDAAAKVVAQLQPSRVIVPMHYKTPALKIAELGPPDAFLAKFKKVLRPETSTLDLFAAAKGQAPAEPDVVVLRYE